MRKYFIGIQKFAAEVETLTQELDQFPPLGENCNININDDFTGTSFIYTGCFNFFFKGRRLYSFLLFSFLH